MEKTPPLLGGFQIKGARSDKKFLVLSDECGKQTRYRVTPEIIFQLAAHLPRYANRLASKLGLVDSSMSEHLRVEVGAVEAPEATVTIDDTGTTLVLSINDAMGMECSWVLSPELAAKLGNALVSKAATTRKIERHEN